MGFAAAEQGFELPEPLKWLTLGLIAAFLLWMLLRAAVDAVVSAWQMSHLRRRGRPAIATIAGYDHVDDSNECFLVVEYQLPGRPRPHQVTLIDAVDFWGAGQRGDEVVILYDRHRPDLARTAPARVVRRLRRGRPGRQVR